MIKEIILYLCKRLGAPNGCAKKRSNSPFITLVGLEYRKIVFNARYGIIL